MIEEKDSILREVKRLTLLLKTLISKVTELDSGDSTLGINETDQALKKEFDLSLKEISKLSDEGFQSRIENMNETHLENLVTLIFELIKKIKATDKEIRMDTQELVKKNIIIINFLGKTSKTFSIERMQIKNILQQYL